MYLDDKHYEQDVYDEEGRVDPPASTGPPAPVAPDPSSPETKSFHRWIIFLALLGGVLTLAWAVPVVRILMIPAAIVIVLWAFAQRPDSWRNPDGSYSTVEEERSAWRTNIIVSAFLWIFQGIVALVSFGSKNDDRNS